MTAVASAAKMVGQLRRWLTGDDVAASHSSAENMSGECSTCSCSSATNRFQYRGRSFSDCCTASCRSSCQNVRERSCSVNSRWMTSQGSKRMGSQACLTSLSGRQRDIREVLDEDREPCRCWSRSVEPVCCCERCFVYVDEPPSVLPPPYSELMLLEHYADLAKRLTNTEPSIIVNTADVTDQVISAVSAAGCTSMSSSAETCPLANGQSYVASKEAEAESSGPTLISSSNCLPPSVHASLDGEEGYTLSQQQLRWARRQRVFDDTLTATSFPPPNRTICHVVDCW